jgi:hypothetical protein
MAVIAERLPITGVPEQSHIAAMSDNVIDDCRLHVLPALEVIGAERMITQVSCARLLPLVSVSPAC